MSARRFFVEGVRRSGEAVTIGGADAHKIVNVLRLHDGAHLEIVDSAGALFDATVETSDGEVRATLRDELPRDDQSGRAIVEIAQAVPKGQKMDFVVEKATELGAAAILPFTSERTVASAEGTAKLERWRRLGKSAAQQCGRRDVPRIDAPIPFAQLLERFADYDAVIFPWELAPQVPVRETLAGMLESAHRVLVVVGPEGGFSHEEAEEAKARGARLVWLGRRILRTETAAMVLLAVLEYL
ncbi:MAG TPA: 16S rRNA (uracil(1498)-N(3))-methyltransferase [Candidatus Cybelea sp.]|nr:16S rRNA (uracil(1498)-N(3))-methyltransferase [Candidatus Cybelea sp.]